MEKECPFDKTTLISAYGNSGGVLYCQNCCIRYGSNSTQEEINAKAKKIVEKYRRTIVDIDKKRGKLVRLIQLAEKNKI